MVNEHPDHATIIRHDLSSLVIAAIICNDYRQEHQLEVEQRRAPSMCSEQRVKDSARHDNYDSVNVVVRIGNFINIFVETLPGNGYDVLDCLIYILIFNCMI